MPVTADLLPQLLEVCNQWLSHPLITFLQVGCLTTPPPPPPVSSLPRHNCAAPSAGLQSLRTAKVDV